jgi:hypothetical protein
MSLAAPERCAEPEDRSNLPWLGAQPRAHVSKQTLESARWVGVGKKQSRYAVFVWCGLLYDLGQIGGKIGFTDFSAYDIPSRDTEIEDPVHSLILRKSAKAVKYPLWRDNRLFNLNPA